MINWDSTIADNDANKLFDQFIDKINKLIDKYMPLTGAQLGIF